MKTNVLEQVILVAIATLVYGIFPRTLFGRLWISKYSVYAEGSIIQKILYYMFSVVQLYGILEIFKYFNTQRQCKSSNMKCIIFGLLILFLGYVGEGIVDGVFRKPSSCSTKSNTNYLKIK